MDGLEERILSLEKRIEIIEKRVRKRRMQERKKKKEFELFLPTEGDIKYVYDMILRHAPTRSYLVSHCWRIGTGAKIQIIIKLLNEAGKIEIQKIGKMTLYRAKAAQTPIQTSR